MHLSHVMLNGKYRGFKTYQNTVILAIIKIYNYQRYIYYVKFLKNMIDHCYNKFQNYVLLAL